MSKHQQQDGAHGDGPEGLPEGPGAAASPDDLAAQLAKERETRALMRDRLRNTEALAAESHALRSRMAQELERAPAERDRLRAAAAAGAVATPAAPATGLPDPAIDLRIDVPPAGPVKPPAPGRPVPPRPAEWSANRPPAARRGPWRALGLLAGLAACAAGIAWITGAMPLDGGMSGVAGAPAPAASAAATAVASTAPSASDVLDRAASAVAASRGEALAAAGAGAGAGASSPEAALAAAPTAAGPSASAPVPDVPVSDVPARLRAALDAEGVLAPVSIDARGGRIAVSDPEADHATRERTDMLIRAVYAGANLPEPQIEHRWVSPPRAGRAASAAAAVPVAAPVAVVPPPAAAHVQARRDASAAAGTTEHHKHAAAAAPAAVAAADEPRVILPMGRVTASCKAAVAKTGALHRAGEMSACMRHSCCSSANRQTEECRAFDKSYPLTCSAG
ncbi:MAG: hypothetical protein ABJD97_12270 [Betaproteobacteria bacterium]